MKNIRSTQIYAAVLKYSFLFLISVLFINIFSVTSHAKYPTWDYKTQKAYGDYYDKYSSTSSAFKNTEWKILSENQVKEIANKSTDTDIKTGSFCSGTVLFGMDTTNAELAYKAFSKMTFNGTKSPYLTLEQMIKYQRPECPKLIVVRCDPSETFINANKPVVSDRYDVTWDVTVRNPRYNSDVSFNDSALIFISNGKYANEPIVTKKYSFDKYSSDSNKLVLKYTYHNVFKPSNVINRPNSNSGGNYLGKIGSSTESIYYYGNKYNTEYQLSATMSGSNCDTSAVRSKYIYKLTLHSRMDLINSNASVFKTNSDYKGASAVVTVDGGNLSIKLNEAAANYYYFNRYLYMRNGSSQTTTTHFTSSTYTSKNERNINQNIFLAFLYSEGKNIMNEYNKTASYVTGNVVSIPTLPIYDGTRISFTTTINSKTRTYTFSPNEATFSVNCALIGGYEWSEMLNHCEYFKYNYCCDFWESASIISSIPQCLDYEAKIRNDSFSSAKKPDFEQSKKNTTYTPISKK